MGHVPVQDVYKSYDHGDAVLRQYILRGIDLEIRRGEFVSILRHSGCGKTTLLQAFTSFLYGGKKIPMQPPINSYTDFSLLAKVDPSLVKIKM